MSSVHPFIRSLNTEIDIIQESIIENDILTAVLVMSTSLARLRPDDKTKHEAFIQKIRGLRDQLRSVGNVSAGSSGFDRYKLAIRSWDDSMLDDFLNVLWEGNYLDNESYGLFYDPAAGRRSRGKVNVKK